MKLTCKSCGEQAQLNNGVIIHTCECKAGFTADMSATCYGEGGAAVSTNWLERVIRSVIATIRKAKG